MIEPLDVYRAAFLLIKEHGEDANLVAAQRADELMASGNVDGARAFKQVLAAVLEIGRDKRLPGELAN